MRKHFVIRFIALFLAAGIAAGQTSRPALDAQIGKIESTLNYKLVRVVDQKRTDAKTVFEAILLKTSWRLKGAPQSLVREERDFDDAMKLPEAERPKVMDRTDDYIIIWAVKSSAEVGPEFKNGLGSVDEMAGLGHRSHREMFYLGKDKDFTWFGYMPIYDFAMLAKQWRLRGDDVVAALIKGVAIDDDNKVTANNCWGLLGKEGPTALPAIDQAIHDHLSYRARLIWAMDDCKDPLVTRWLMKLTQSDDKDVAATAQYTLLISPRPEAAELYVQWLAEGAGNRMVVNELCACAAVNAKAGAPSLEKVLAAPSSVYEYRRAFELSRQWRGVTIMPPAMISAEQEIMGLDGAGEKVDRSVEAILAAGDIDAAAIAGLSLAVYHSKGRAEVAHDAGMRILRSLPDEKGRHLADLLARTNREDDWMKQQIVAVAQQLSPAPVTLHYVDIRGGKPPSRSYFVDLELKNTYDKPVWFVFAYWSDRPLKESAGRIIGEFDNDHHLEGMSYGGQVSLIEDAGNFKAMRVPPGGTIQFDYFPLGCDSPIDAIDVLAVDSLKINGQISLEQWVPYETLCSTHAHVTVAQSSDTKNLNWDPKIEAERLDLRKDEIKFVQAEVLGKWKVPIRDVDLEKSKNPWK